jgi:hypothetical protein
MMDFSSKRGENHSNSKLLRGFSTKYRRKIRVFMSQEEQNAALGLEMELLLQHCHQASKARLAFFLADRRVVLAGALEAIAHFIDET